VGSYIVLGPRSNIIFLIIIFIKTTSLYLFLKKIIDINIIDRESSLTRLTNLITI